MQDQGFPQGMKQATVVFASGGSGGHLFPALAVAKELQRFAGHHISARFFCSAKPIDTAILNTAGFQPEPVTSESSAAWRSPWRIMTRNWAGYRQARRRLREIQADCVVGCGGYVSVPTVLAARSLGIPVILLEQNLLPGRATRWLSRFGDVICISFPETLNHLPQTCRNVTRVTGNPLRQQITTWRQPFPRDSNGKPQLLILGGSQGSKSLDDLLVPVLGELADVLSDWEIVHQSGSDDPVELATHYIQAGIRARVTRFLESIEQEYLASNLVIARAGATTLWELACLGLPAVLIPFAAARDDHQTLNARWFADRQAAWWIDSRNPHAAAVLRENLPRLLRDAPLRKKLAEAMYALGNPQAAETVAQLIAGFLSHSGSPRTTEPFPENAPGTDSPN